MKLPVRKESNYDKRRELIFRDMGNSPIPEEAIARIKLNKEGK
jgi:hypothetical protein